jgi:hypothetical protein
MSHKYGNCLIAVDVCGIGGGVVDRLIEMGDNVLAIDNAGRADEPEKYYNKRAEIWCRAGERCYFQ